MRSVNLMCTATYLNCFLANQLGAVMYASTEIFAVLIGYGVYNAPI